MELILERGLEHQQLAVDAIRDVFKNVNIYPATRPEENPKVDLHNWKLKDNIRKIQEHVLAEHQGSSLIDKYLNLDIKMETGTGKTYVYTHAIYELNHAYGFNKFIIVVPTLPIKAGTQQFISDPYTKRHFADGCGYGKEIELLTLEARKKKKGKQFFPAAVRDFVTGSNRNSNKIYVLLLNMQLLTGGKLLTDTYDFGIEGMFQPLSAIASTRPVGLIDEPHRFSKGQKAFGVISEKLKPQCIIRFGATFPETETGRGKNKKIVRDYHNLIYEVDACEAFNQNLIKGVAKEHFPNPSHTDEKLKIVNVKKGDSATFHFIRKGTAAQAQKLSVGDSLAIFSPAFNGITIEAITANSVTFSNGITRNKGEELDVDIYMTSYQEGMLKLALERHFEAEKQNFCRRRYKIKTLALFFIDDIGSYRNEAGDEKEPYLRNMFERLLKEKLLQEISGCDAEEQEYKEFLQYSLDHLAECHAGYFAQDNQDSDENIRKEVDDILHNKKKLLSFYDKDGRFNVRRFLFSKWTLKEGWDNPNVFTIAKLRSSGSEISKLQEVGRGLRLPVDENGNRIANEEFFLNYIVDFTEADFAQELVDEINKERPPMTEVSEATIRKVADLRKTLPSKLMIELLQKEYLDYDRKIIQKNRARFLEEYPEFNTGLQAGKVRDRQQQPLKNIPVRPAVYEELRQLWEAVNKDYLLLFDAEINKELPSVIPKLLRRSVFDELYLTSEREVVSATEINAKTIHEAGYTVIISNPISYGEFLRRVNKAALIPIPVLHRAVLQFVKENGPIDRERINEQAVSRFLGLFDEWKLQALQGRFHYAPCRVAAAKKTALSNADGTPVKTITAGRIGTKTDQGNAPEKYLYDIIAYDSPLERKNILTSIEEIVVYGKIPRNSIAIPTIAGGTYSPDFMYVVKRKDGTKELNVIVETKDVEKESDLRDLEKIKIGCAEEFFAQMQKDGMNIRFVKQLKKDAMSGLLKKVLGLG